MEKKSLIGGDYPIHDAALKVTGAEVYTGDLRLKDLRYAKILCSEKPHAIIAHIDVDRALALEGVDAVYTYEDVPNIAFNNYLSFAGQDAPADECLLTRHTRFVGDRIAAVVAESTEIASRALELIRVEYEELPFCVSCTEARMQEAAPIHPGGNLLSTALVQCGDVDKVIAEGNGESFFSTMHLQRVHHGALENHVCLATYDLTGRLVVYTSCQGAFGVRYNVADFLKMPLSMVRVVKMPTGGSFGGKQQSIIEILAAWLAKQTGGAVLLEFDRPQSILSTSVATAMDFEVHSIVTSDERIIALDIDALVDAGGYATNTADIQFSAGKKAFRLYRIPNMRFSSAGYYTNTTPAGGFRGWGGPQVFTALETHVDIIAKYKGLDPVQFRLNNLVEPGDEDPVIHLSLGNARIKECLLTGADVFNWQKRKEDTVHMNAGTDERFRRGIGLACAGHVNGYAGSVHDFATTSLRMNEDGSLTLNTAVHDQGCGSLISLALIVAEILEVPLEKINVLEADTDTSPYDMGSYASRVTYVSGRCVYEAAFELKKLIRASAAELMNVPENLLSIGNGRVFIETDPGTGLDYGQIATMSHMNLKREMSVVQRWVSETNPASYGCHFAEVEVDKKTGLVHVVDYLAVHDLGRAINRQIVEGQIQGAVQMGIGYALSEEVGYDNKGYPLCSNFDKYTVANAPDMPHTQVIILEYGGDEGPFGAKSIGEVALNGVPAAVVNAVNNALGTEINKLPLTPKRIVNAIYEGNGR